MDGIQIKLPEALPGFMLPSVYFPIDRIPLAVTGKADQKRLREIANALSLEQLLNLQSSILTRSEHSKPGTDIENRLHQI